MTAHRKAAVVTLLGTVPLLLTALAAGPASAHGAPTDPVSRAAACSPEGGAAARSAACKAATAGRGGRLFADWDNLRVANVRGRDREVIPDGKLCSGGLEQYAGLDLPRADWPATRIKGGGDFTLTYRSTIPHRGKFRLYITKDGYDPARPLRWSDLNSRPFTTATDPALANGSYRMRAELPQGLQGRHVLYTIWQNSDTPDTYYSCSDVIIVSPGGGSGKKQGSGGSATGKPKSPGHKTSATGKPSGGSTSPQAPPGAGADDPSGSVALSEPVSSGSGQGTGSDTHTRAAGAGATVLIVAAGVAAATLRRRRS